MGVRRYRQIDKGKNKRADTETHTIAFISRQTSKLIETGQQTHIHTQ